MKLVPSWVTAMEPLTSDALGHIVHMTGTLTHHQCIRATVYVDQTTHHTCTALQASLDAKDTIYGKEHCEQHTSDLGHAVQACHANNSVLLQMNGDNVTSATPPPLHCAMVTTRQNQLS